MKVLFIGGTGNISHASSTLALKRGFTLYLLTRGKNTNFPDGAQPLICDINNRDQVAILIKDHHFDVIVNWIAFNPNDIQRDYELFAHKTDQYIFISSASCYQKPLRSPIITESTPLINPYWDYSRNKIACEELLLKLYRSKKFPITIIRPSFTYETVIPAAIGGWNNYNVIDRMKKGKKIIVHGDGTSLWTITHAQDFAKGFVGILGNQKAIGESFHITSDEVLTWNQIYQSMAHAVGKEVNMIHIPSDFIGTFNKDTRSSLLGDKAECAIFDTSKIKQFVPDFKAEIPFAEGIKSTIKWFEAVPDRMHISDHEEVFIEQVITAFEKGYS